MRWLFEAVKTRCCQSQQLARGGTTLPTVPPAALPHLATTAGTEAREALARCLPPEVQLECSALAWVPGRLLELEVTLVRVEGSGGASSRTPAKLLVGTLHDNALLLCRPLCMESFASPMSLRVRTQAPVKGGAEPVQVRGTGWCGQGRTVATRSAERGVLAYDCRPAAGWGQETNPDRGAATCWPPEVRSSGCCR